MRALWTASALFMTGQRLAINCRFVIVPPPGDWCVAVERERRVAGEVFFRNGHMALDWLSRDSIVQYLCRSMDLCGVAGVRNRIERQIFEECRVSPMVRNLGLIRHVDEPEKVKKGQRRQAVDGG